ncbi:hypothetical protein B7463_g6124, partial [Scytalidium lignicola]
MFPFYLNRLLEQQFDLTALPQRRLLLFVDLAYLGLYRKESVEEENVTSEAEYTTIGCPASSTSRSLRKTPSLEEARHNRLYGGVEAMKQVGNAQGPQICPKDLVSMFYNGPPEGEQK